MSRKHWMAAAAASTLSLSGLGAAAAEMVTVGGYTLSDTSFGSEFGVHFISGSENVLSAVARVNQDNSTVTFSSTDPFDTSTNGEAVISDTNCVLNPNNGNCTGNQTDPFDNLLVTFGHSWDKVTFSFDGGDTSLMTLVVNGTVTFTAAGLTPNCTFCVIGNGQTKFTIEGGATPISTLAFTFAPEVGSGRQFRVMDVADGGGPNEIPVPEPATWVMMILGFGSAGAMLRRRRVGALA